MELVQQQEGQQRQPLASSLRWLQFSLLLLFGHDVLCFSLGYPFLPQVFGGAATGVAFSCYGLASIAVLLLLLFCSSSTSNNSSAAKFWRILSAAAFAAVAGAANTALPASYAVLLLTKAAQGTASALYFCESLSLVAAVYPRAYRTQAMAFISAGLTVGDALGPVIGGLVYQAAGLQGALALQPAASLVAVAALGLLLVWPTSSRPWSLQSILQQQQQQQVQQQSDEEQGYAQLAAASCCAEDVAWGSSRAAGLQQQGMHSAGSKDRVPKLCQDSLLEPLLPRDQQPSATAAAGADAAPLLLYYAACEAPLQHANHSQQPCPSQPQQLQPPRPTHDTPSSAAAASTAAPAGAGERSRPQLLLQLLQHPSIVSLCLLAFMAQAARTAVDLLLPIMLGAAVQPGVIGLLFAGEAVGSVVAPFLVDWLLHRHSSNSSSSSSSSGKEASSSSNSSKSSSSSLASWLLLLSATGMAVCCAAVLTLWQLPAALHSIPAVSQQPAAAAATPTPTPTPLSLLVKHPAAAAQYTTGLGADVQKHPVGCQQGAFGGSIWTGNSNSSSGGGSMSSRLCHLMVLKGLQHSHWDAYSAALAPRQTVGSTMTPTSSFGSVVVGRLGGFSGVAAGHTDGSSFGVVELVIIGLVLMLLGSWHSSCETLIYTVLTDIITPPTSDGCSVVDEAVTVYKSVGRDVLLGGSCTCCAGQLRVCGESADACSHGCGTHALQDSRCCESECCREGADCLRQQQLGNGTVGVDASAAACAGSVVPVCGVSSSTAGSDADSSSGSSSADGDMEVSVQDGSSHHSSGSHCEAVYGSTEDTSASDSVCAGCCGHSDCCADLRHADGALAGGLRLDPSASEATTGYAAQGSQQSFDCSEVVMVLYVLFWVMGFSAGAGVVGMVPGTSLVELQAVATVLAVLLAVAGRWTWMAVGL